MKPDLPARRRVAVGAKSVEHMCSGSGRPVIVLLNGHGMPLNTWERLYPHIETLGTVLNYDRVGVGNSDKPDVPQVGTEIIATLLQLLRILALPPPYVLVGHSLGGLYINLFARVHPEKVAGVVFVEAGHPDEAILVREEKGLVARGLERVLDMFGSSFKDDPNSDYNSVAETERQIEAAGAFPSVPLGVVTGARKMPFAPKRHFVLHQQKQKELVAQAPDAQHFVAPNSGHLP